MIRASTQFQPEKVDRVVVASKTAALFDENDAAQWFVLHTRSRQEKKLTQDLDSFGIRVLLPCIRRQKFYGKRRAFVEEPLFPGYVFLRGDVEEAYRADRTGRVASLIPVHNQAQLNWELRNIALMLEMSDQAPIGLFPHLKVGLRAEVRSGPFKGIQGLIELRLQQNRLMLQVEMLGHCVALDIEGALLDIVE